ncbi:MAG: PAS domain S-box protein, partial [Nitrospirales bacterium]|nr:PAS domain S-box protein [Nitrospirales bacterium]
KKGSDGSILPFTDEDASILEGFAAIIAIVIDKSILYEKTLAQEREAEALRDYLTGLIENSADAIITTDLKGIVTSWNMGAEKIYGYKKDEVVGGRMPIIPEFLQDMERDFTQQVRDNKTLKDIETTRRTREGILIDVSLTLSPIKDAHGNIIGICGISRDISEKKRTERDLMKKNNMLFRLFFINSVMRGTLELDKLLRMVLTAVTMGDGLGFNRAMLFLVDEEKNLLRGAMGVGPSSHEEAWHIWSTLSMERKDLQTLMDEIEKSPLRKDSFMDRLCCGLEIPLDTDTVITRSVKEKIPYNVFDVHSEPLADHILIQQLGTLAYAVVPLISKGKVIGVIWVDNLFSRRPISADDIEFLTGFTDQIASAIENARLFEHIYQAEQELEKIFEAISDFVYFSSRDYTLKKVNKAVLEKFNLPADKIIGRKCYEVFHGMDAPWHNCPHFKTLASKKSFIEELDDPNMGGTYLVSSSPILDSSGEIQGTVHIARDISEIRKLREMVASAERMAALGQMAAKVAHEIRNPLALIGGFARRLGIKLAGEQKEYSSIIVEEVARLEEILKDTLSFVKTSNTEKKQVSLNDLVSNIITLLEPTVHDKGNSLQKEAMPLTYRTRVKHNEYFAKLQKEGEEGRKKITQYTRYGTVAISLMQAWGVVAKLLSTTPGGVP